MAMQDLMWELFLSTGNIDVYLLYRSYVLESDADTQALLSELKNSILRGQE